MYFNWIFQIWCRLTKTKSFIACKLKTTFRYENKANYLIFIDLFKEVVHTLLRSICYKQIYMYISSCLWYSITFRFDEKLINFQHIYSTAQVVESYVTIYLMNILPSFHCTDNEELLLIDFIHWQDFLGRLECSLGEIVGGSSGRMEAKLQWVNKSKDCIISDYCSIIWELIIFHFISSLQGYFRERSNYW